MGIHDRLKAESDEAASSLLAMNTEPKAEVKEEATQVIESKITPKEPLEEAQQEAETIDWEAEAKRNEQRYKVIQGKYNAELPKLQAEIRQLREEASKIVPEATKDEEDDFPELTERVKPLEEKLQQFEAKQAQTEAEQSNDQLLRELTSLVPNWQEINVNPDFLSWLSEDDPMTGTQRQQAVTDAEQNRDAVRISAIMETWQATQQRKAVTRPNDLERKVTPSNKAGGEPKGKRTYTHGEIDQHFKSVRLDKRNGNWTEERERQAKQFERELFAAEIDGRIIY